MAPPAATRNFQQHQPITTALRQICESYPAGTCLRELLQNADDAEATEIEYVLDTKTYSKEPLLYEGLRHFQGPALLARNNRIFTDKDFASLASIGDSRKRHDLAATGKFGQGFNSCYHWTDGPWIYSNDTLLLLDPHEDWSIPTGKPGGPAWDVISGGDSEELQNHLKTFGAMTSDFSKPLDGTIIRIPLRTKAQAAHSKIVQKEVTIQDIIKALTVLGREVREGGLLFLKHVRTMVVRIDDEVMWEVHLKERCSDQPSVRDELTADFKTLFMQPGPTNDTVMISKSFVLDMIFKEKAKETTSPFTVHHLMLQSSGDHELDVWARSKKLFPWVAVGAPLKESAPKEPFKGRLFSILRLPIETGHPVHIHGLFSITPDRGRLSSSGQTPGHEDFEVKWNTFMFERCVAEAWASLLQTRNDSSWKEEIFNLWPRVEDSPTEIWTKLDDFLLRQILSSNLSVWNTRHGCVAASEGFFTSSDSETATKYAQALESVRLPAVHLKSALLSKSQSIASETKTQLRSVSPETVRCYLRKNIYAISDSISSLVLEYCLLDAFNSNRSNHVRQTIYEGLKPLPLWPTVEGPLRDLAQVALLLPRNTEELSIFELSRPGSTIDIRKLSQTVNARVTRDVALGVVSSMRRRTLSDLSIDWPMIYGSSDGHQPSQELSQPRSTEKDGILKRCWAWIESRFQEEHTFPEVIAPLFLLPIKGDRIRRCMPGPDSRPMLVVEASDKLYRLLDIDRASSEPYLEAAQVLDCRALTSSATKLIREQTPRISSVSAASADDAASLVHWLAANVPLITQVSESNRVTLLDILRRLITEKWGFRAKDIDRITSNRVASELIKLPLFTRLHAKPPYKDWLPSTCDLLVEGISLKRPQDLPAICPVPGINFYAASEHSEKHVLESFKLLQEMTTETLLIGHLLPFVFSQHSVDLDGVKDSLADYALEKSAHKGQDWIRKLNQIPLIPLKIHRGQPRAWYRLIELVDPESRLAKLFFSDELVFPNQHFFDRHRTALRQCGLPSAVSPQIIFERVQHYAQFHKTGELLKKVHKMVASSVDPTIFQDANIIFQIRTLEWLPVTLPSGKLVRSSPTKSRGIEDSDLVDHVYGILDSKISKDWRRLLGWDTAIDEEVLVDQLDACLRFLCHGQIDKVIHYLYKHYGLSSIQSRQCLRTVRQSYIEPSRAILPDSDLDRFPLSPYLEPLDESFIITHPRLIHELEINPKPSLEDLMKVQQAISILDNGEIVQDEHLNIIKNVLEIASRSFGSEDLVAVQIPDSRRKLTPLADIVHGDAGATIKGADIQYTHPALSAELVKRLGIESLRERAVRLQVAIEDEDEDEYVPREELTTIISDTLTRYPITATFSEFLANAEDCSATKISWILDDRGASYFNGQNLMTAELQALQGSALFCHNDSVFTEKDFEGYKDIGRGGKQADTTSIGLFGRGSMTMYHFTDNPMILSGDTLVILDPQQRLLPKTRNYKHRKAGVKLSLDTFKQNYPDQLLPFDGLCSYDKEKSFYQGTLFRMPLKRPSDVEKSLNVLEVRRLLMEYYSLARDSLLFLRSVRSIEFRERKQAFAQWSICADFSLNLAGGIYEQLRLRGKQREMGQFEELWHIQMIDREQVPEDVPVPNVGKLKITELGVAACVQSEVVKGEDVSNLMVASRKIHCKLPTTYESGLPVALSATFAMSSDRRTIFTEERRDPTSRWNHWLLKTCLPDLYIEFLKYLSPILGTQVFQFWPSVVANASPIAQLVQAAFWEKITSPQCSQYPLYPVLEGASSPNDSTMLRTRKSGARKLHPVVSIDRAEFDMLPSKVSRFLHPLISNLCLRLVRPTGNIRAQLIARKTSGMTLIDSNYLCNLLRQERNLAAVSNFLSTFEGANLKSKALEVVLLETVPEYIEGREEELHVLDGCQILPRHDGSISMLSLVDLAKRSAVNWALLPSLEERSIFGFAGTSLVASGLFADPMSNDFARPEFMGRNPIEELMMSSFNIRQIEVTDIKQLLSQKTSPLAANKNLSPDEEWFSRLWVYLQKHLSKADKTKAAFSNHRANCTSLLNLGNCPIYRWQQGGTWRYLTPNNFEMGAFLVKSALQEEVVLCQELNELGLIDRAHVESALVNAEPNLKYKASFERMLRAMRRAEQTCGIPIQKLVSNRLSKSSIKVLRDLVLCHAMSPNTTDDIQTYRVLPLWPRHPSTSAAPCLAAQDAFFCRHAPLLEWLFISNASLGFVDAEYVRAHETQFTKLGFHVKTATEVFSKLIEGNLPKALIQAQTRPFYNFIECLYNNSIRTSKDIVPNGRGIFCSAKALYDHSDSMFQAAFREEQQNLDRFVRSEFRPLRSYWVSIGLRTKLSPDVYWWGDYLACVQATDKRWKKAISRNNQFSADAMTVASYLDFDKPSFRNWGYQTWETIAAATIFAVKTDFFREGTYRQPKMRERAQSSSHRCLQEVGRPSDVRICWSEVPFLERPPTAYVYEVLGTRLAPQVGVVYRHLVYLMEICNQVGARDIAEILRDLQACYSFLQDNWNMTSNIQGIKEAEIWLNLDTTDVEAVMPEQLKDHITSASHLCINCIAEPEGYRNASKFLSPYEKLLKALGVQALVARNVRKREHGQVSKSPAEYLIDNQRRLRAQSRMFDVTFLAKQDPRAEHPVEIPAHKFVLAAVSSYCEAQFSGPWGAVLSTDRKIVIEDIKPDTLRSMIDFAYCGTADWIPVADKKNNELVAERVDELLDLLQGADMWLMEKLHAIVQDHFIDHFDTYVRPDNVLAVMRELKAARADRVVGECEEFVRENKDFVVRFR